MGTARPKELARKLWGDDIVHSHKYPLYLGSSFLLLSSLLLYVLICLRLKIKGGVTDRGQGKKRQLLSFLSLAHRAMVSLVAGGVWGFLFNFVYTDTLPPQNIEWKRISNQIVTYPGSSLRHILIQEIKRWSNQKRQKKKKKKRRRRRRTIEATMATTLLVPFIVGWPWNTGRPSWTPNQMQ